MLKNNDLIKYYKLMDSIKKYKGYKVKSPNETINTIAIAFKKLNLKIEYELYSKTVLLKYYPFKVGAAFLKPESNENVVLLRSGGKGVTPELSHASASAELIERFTGYGAISFGNINYYLSQMKLNKLWMEKNRNKKIKDKFVFHPIINKNFICSDLEENLQKSSKNICYSLTKKKIYSYPEEFIVKLEGSNGLASGNTKEEASLHAIFEVLERLVGMYFLDNLPTGKKISKESYTHPTVLKLMDAVSEASVDFEIFDLSYVFGIPIIITIFDHKKWDIPINPYSKVTLQYPKIIIGVDTNPQDATMRCFTEFIQGSEPIYYSIFNDVEVYNQFKLAKLKITDDQINQLKTSTVAFRNSNQPIGVNLRSYVKNQKDTVDIDELPDLYDVNQKIEINTIVNKLKNKNIEILVHNITHPVLGFPVVRAMLSGGAEYFSKIPNNGYARLVLNSKDEKERYSRFNKIVESILTENSFHKLIRKEKWLKGVDLDKMIKTIISELIYTGTTPDLWGITINRFYFLGMLYLKNKNIDKAFDCFNAALNQNSNNLGPLLGIAYIYDKKKMKKEYEYTVTHISTINPNVNVVEEIKEFNKPVINPNPFEPCDFDCKNKNKSYLCEKCFFGYVPEEQFMIQKTDKMI